MLGYAVLDVETTGLNPRRDRVVQIAITQVSPTGQVERSWSSLVNPERDPGPVHVHGLSAPLLDSAPLYAHLAPTVAELTRDRILVAHNVDFDWAFLRHEHARARVPLPVSTRLCTMDLTRRLRVPVRDLRLATLAAHWDISQEHAHDAVDDTRVLVGVFQSSLQLAQTQGAQLPTIACTGAAGSWQRARRSRWGYATRRRYYRARRRVRRIKRQLAGRG